MGKLNLIDWLKKDSGLNFFIGFGLSLLFYIFLCGMIIIQNSNNSTTLQLILMSVPNLLLVIVTVAYVILTQKLVKTNQALFDAQTEPIVIAHLRLNDVEDTEFIQLIIENVGLGAARNVIFDINPKGICILDGDFDCHSLIQKGISVLGPKQRVSIRLCLATLGMGSSQRMFHPNYIPPFQITVTYQNSIGKNIGPDHFSLDIGIFKDQ